MCDTIVSNSGEQHIFSRKVKDVISSAAEKKTPKPSETHNTTVVDKQPETPTATSRTTKVDNPIPTIS